MEYLLDLQTCLQYNVAKASSFRNIKHKFPNKLYKREHAGCQGFAPINTSIFFSTKMSELRSFFIVKHHGKPIGLANLFAI